jgi:hypothetical protein
MIRQHEDEMDVAESLGKVGEQQGIDVCWLVRAEEMLLSRGGPPFPAALHLAIPDAVGKGGRR